MVRRGVHVCVCACVYGWLCVMRHMVCRWSYREWYVGVCMCVRVWCVIMWVGGHTEMVRRDVHVCVCAFVYGWLCVMRHMVCRWSYRKWQDAVVQSVCEPALTVPYVTQT